MVNVRGMEVSEGARGAACPVGLATDGIGCMGLFFVDSACVAVTACIDVSPTGNGVVGDGTVTDIVGGTDIGADGITVCGREVDTADDEPYSAGLGKTVVNVDESTERMYSRIPATHNGCASATRLTTAVGIHPPRSICIT